MTLKFAYKWNWNYDANKVMTFNYADARALIKAAIESNLGVGALKDEINTGDARVVRAPHRTSGGDSRMHLSVHCKDARVIYHIYISKNGNCSGCSQEPVSGTNPKTGHVKDDWSAPNIDTCDDL